MNGSVGRRARGGVPALLLLGLFSHTAGCGSPEALREPDRPVADNLPARRAVFTVNYPLAYFAERIGGDRVEVHFPAPPGVDPAEWLPTNEVVAAYQAADLILINGAGYAGWISRVALPESRIVDTSGDFTDELIPEAAVTHSHGPQGDHSHVPSAGTVWLDPSLAMVQASAVAEALAKVDPEGRADYDAARAALQTDLEGLDRELAAAAAALSEGGIVFSRPVYQYLARRLGVEHRAVHWEPGQAPQGDEWRLLEQLVRQEPTRWMIWEGEPHAETATRLAELGLASVVYEVCANRPNGGDFLDAMRENVARLRAAAP